jgi:precorrin-4 methylase
MPDAIARVRRACAAAGVRFGVAGPDDPELLASLAGPGADLLVLGADVRIYAGALSEAVERLRHEAHAHEREEGHVRA